MSLLREKWWAVEVYLFRTISIYLPPTTLAECGRMWSWEVLVYLKNSTGQNENTCGKKCSYIFDDH